MEQARLLAYCSPEEIRRDPTPRPLEARLGLSADELALAVPALWMRAVASVAGLARPTGPGSCRRRLTKRRAELAVVQVLCTNE
jgi:hypothetical protein